MSLNKILQTAVSKAVKDLYGIDAAPETIVLQSTRKDFEGNLSVVVFPWVKAAKKAPEAVANEIGEWLVKNEKVVERFNSVKGFLNLVICPTYWNSVLADIDKAEDYGKTKATENSPLVIEL